MADRKKFRTGNRANIDHWEGLVIHRLSKKVVILESEVNWDSVSTGQLTGRPSTCVPNQLQKNIKCLLLFRFWVSVSSHRTRWLRDNGQTRELPDNVQTEWLLDNSLTRKLQGNSQKRWLPENGPTRRLLDNAAQWRNAVWKLTYGLR